MATMVETLCLHVDALSGTLSDMTPGATEEDKNMADAPPDPNLGVGVRLGRGKQPPPRPRWVNVFGIVVIVLVLLFLVLHLTGLVPTHMSMHG
jgi:hypothetical protein